ncbi:MAG: hypothetical protein V1904_11620 [Bacteroidota bacterium]
MFLQRIALPLLTVVMMVLVNSCDIINPEEPVPSYIHIDKFNLSTTIEQGSNSSRISDAWVYVDDQLIGAFELPATMPVLFEGVHKVMVKPGIKVNGIAGTRAIYPFYTYYSLDIILIPDSVITVNPSITYNAETVFIWKEAFEDGGISIETTPFSDTIIEKTLPNAPEVFEGNYSGIIHLDDNHTLFEGRSINSFDLPGGDTPVFLEMNYKTESEIYMGLFANSSTQSDPVGILTLNKSSTWNKIYINLKNAINSSTSATDFQVFFHIEKSSDVTNSVILLDNIKLVHF